MSGIVGIYQLDGQPVEFEHLGRMVNVLAHRGPDGSDIWFDGSVGLGHRLLWTTPESLLEKLPLVDQTGNLVLTADARIDNRDELIAALSLNDYPAAKIADSQIILAAYEKWGNQCPEKLIGDFAFAIWDKRKRILFCARDHMGVKPFYYYIKSGKFFAFASEIKGLLCLEALPHKVNEAKVGIYLCQLTGFAAPNQETFYEDILRFPPAHWMELSERRIKFNSYWDLDAEAKKIQVQLKSDSEYVEAFKERFTEAIRCRLRSAFPVASTLSGGLDSSSVSCMARNILKEQNNQVDLLTVYADCAVPSSDEKEYVNSVLSKGEFKHHLAKVISPLRAAQIVSPWIDRPLGMPSAAISLAAMQSVCQRGAKVMMTGYDGDTIVSHGRNYPTELISKAEWAYLKQLLQIQVNRHRNKISSPKFKSKFESKLYSYLLSYLESLMTDFQFKNYISTLLGAYYNLSLSPRKILKLIARSLAYQKNFMWTLYNLTIDSDFADRISLNQLIKNEILSHFKSSQSVFLNHELAIKSNNLQDVVEQHSNMSAILGLEIRYPFFDKRLIEICLAVPAHLKFDKGFGRGVMRKAMKNIMPEKVRLRASKVNFSEHIMRGLLKEDSLLLKKILFDNDSKLALSYYVDTDKLYKNYQKILTIQSNDWRNWSKAKIISRTCYLSLWLKQLDSV